MITLNGTTGITNDGGYTGDGVVFADTTPANTLVTDTSGNVGIGTSFPSYRLDVSHSSFDVARFITSAANTDARINIQGNGTGLGALNAVNNGLVFQVAGTERARIDSSGNFLWQKTSVSSNTNGINFENDGTNVARISIGGANSSGATGISVYSTTAGAFRFFVSYSGQINATSTSITAISDASLKENVRDLETGLSEVMALRPRRFDWKEETQLPDKNVAGFIAQEVEQVLPELVYDYQYSADATKKSLKMGDILPTLVKAIQEQQTQISDQLAIINAQAATITSMQADIAALKTKVGI